MSIPENLKYTEDHEWVRVEANNIAFIGITDHAADQLGDIVYLDIDSVDQTIDMGDEFGSIEAVKTVAELYMPVTGKILEVNPKVHESGDDDPETINRDPYGEGWIIKIEMMNPDELDELLDAEAYKSIIS